MGGVARPPEVTDRLSQPWFECANGATTVGTSASTEHDWLPLSGKYNHSSCCNVPPELSMEATQSNYSLAFSFVSFATMNSRISSGISRSFSHCSLYKVTGKRPIP